MRLLLSILAGGLLLSGCSDAPEQIVIPNEPGRYFVLNHQDLTARLIVVKSDGSMKEEPGHYAADDKAGGPYHIKTDNCGAVTFEPLSGRSYRITTPTGRLCDTLRLPSLFWDRLMPGDD